MEEWLAIPKRRRGLPVWRLCALMAVTFLILWVGSPVLFFHVFEPAGSGN